MMIKSKKTRLRWRQIHLDFHTSENLPNIGGEFDEKEFVRTLKKAHVNSVTAFATCHHGWAYYPTKLKGLRHPNLQTDLFGRMFSACMAEGINVIAYLTVMWNAKEAREHPDWLVRPMDGMADMQQGHHANSPKPMGGGWQRMCYNSPYIDERLVPETRELLELYNPPGFFFDITGEFECICDNCLRRMDELGLDPESKADRWKLAQISYAEYLEKISGMIRKHNPNASIYHNGRDKKGRHDLYRHFTHHEIECLPTGVWGYTHLPTHGRYYPHVPGYDVLSMTGKFNTMWGENGGFKSTDALRYEMAQIISLGLKCSIGDQLHPYGTLDKGTYERIGKAYKYVIDREEYCEDVVSVCDVAVLGRTDHLKDRDHWASEFGASRMLLEMHIPFDVVDDTMDLTKYKILIFPDRLDITEDFKAKLNEFSANGGAIIGSYKGGMNKDGDFAVDFGVKAKGLSKWDTEHLVVGEKVNKDQVPTPYLCYEGGIVTEVVDAEVLAETWKPFFNRTWGRFSGHRNTPVEGPAGYPGVVKKGNNIYFSHPIFRMYNNKGMQLYRDLFRNCFELLYKDPLFTADYPASGRVNVNYQYEANRTVIHLLYATPVKKGEIEAIEDIIPIYDIPVTLKIDKPNKVYLAPEGKEIPYIWENGILSFTLQKLEMHAMIVAE